GPLDTVVDGMQQPADMRRVVVDTERASNHLRHALARPDLPAEAVCFWPALHERGELRQLFGAEPRLPTSTWMAAQPVLYPMFACPLEPLAHRTRRPSEGSGDLLLFPARLLQLPGASPPSLAPVEPDGFAAHPASVPSL